MENKVDIKHVEEFCTNAGLTFYSVSSKTGEGVDEMFTDICEKLIKQSKLRPQAAIKKIKNRKFGL